MDKKDREESGFRVGKWREELAKQRESSKDDCGRNEIDGENYVKIRNNNYIIFSTAIGRSAGKGKEDEGEGEGEGAAKEGEGRKR